MTLNKKQKKYLLVGGAIFAIILMAFKGGKRNVIGSSDDDNDDFDYGTYNQPVVYGGSGNVGGNSYDFGDIITNTSPPNYGSSAAIDTDKLAAKICGCVSDPCRNNNVLSTSFINFTGF